MIQTFAKLTLLSFALILPVGAQEKPPKTTVIRSEKGRHRFVVRYVVGPLRKQLHHAKIVRQGKGEDDEDLSMAYLDGKPEWNRKGETWGTKNWYGTDGGLPSSEFYSFRVSVDGKNWVVPRRLWGDCYEPYPVEGALSPDGRKLTLRMDGSDGAGSYTVVWHLRSNGAHRREFPPRE